MKTFYIGVPPHDTWGIVVIYDYDRHDKEELEAIMDSFGLNEYRIIEAMNVLKRKNSGMTISRQDLRMSAVFISDATSIDEWCSTAIHEFIHVADAILDYYGEDWHGESSAYLVGYLTKELVRNIEIPCFY